MVNYYWIAQDFQLHLAQMRSKSLVHHSEEPPRCLAQFLDPDFAGQLEEQIAEEFEYLLNTEAMELRGELHRTTSPLAKVYWRLNKWTRLVVILIATGQKDLAKKHLRHMFQGFGDEKIVEDLHAAVRELDMAGKNNVTGIVRRFCNITQSNVLEKRGFNTITASDKEVAQNTYGRISKVVAALKQRCTVVMRPSAEWQRITLQRDWASPNPETLYVGCAAWRWVVHFWRHIHRAGPVTLADGWVTQLLHFTCIYCGEDGDYFQVVVPGEWSALVCPVRSAEDLYKRDLRKPKPLFWTHVHRLNINRITHIPVQTITRDRRAAYLQDGEPQPLVKATMRRGIALSAPHWRQLAGFCVPEDHLQVLLRDMTPFEILLLVFFEDEEERQLARQNCKGALDNKSGFEDAIDDPVMCWVLDCMDDDVHGNKHDGGIGELRSKRARKRHREATSKIKLAFKKGAEMRKTLFAERVKKKAAAAAKKAAKAKAKAAPKPAPAPKVAPKAPPAVPPAVAPKAPPEVPHAKKKPYARLQHCAASAVDGGEIRYDLIRSQFGAHCAMHSKSCKMDRQCKKGPLGHMGAWLKLAVDDPAMTEETHQGAKLRDDLLPLPSRKAARDEICERCPDLAGEDFFHYRKNEEPEALTR